MEYEPEIHSPEQARGNMVAAPPDSGLHSRALFALDGNEEQPPVLRSTSATLSQQGDRVSGMYIAENFPDSDESFDEPSEDFVGWDEQPGPDYRKAEHWVFHGKRLPEPPSSLQQDASKWEVTAYMLQHVLNADDENVMLIVDDVKKAMVCAGLIISRHPFTDMKLLVRLPSSQIQEDQQAR